MPEKIFKVFRSNVPRSEVQAWLDYIDANYEIVTAEKLGLFGVYAFKFLVNPKNKSKSNEKT